MTAHTGNGRRGRLPTVPVYDLQVKAGDLVAGTHGRSFWILDDITPLRALPGPEGVQLLPPRQAVRFKLHFAALRGMRAGTSTALAFGIGGGITTHELPGGGTRREHLDVGENPPLGALLHYWLPEADAEPVVIVIADAAGAEVTRFRSDDEDLAASKRPTTRRGLNRFVWDLRYPGPAKLDKTLMPATDALASDGDSPAGPYAVPGNYRVTLTAGSETRSADLVVRANPNVTATAADYQAQFALLTELTDALSRLHGAVNRIRRLKGGLGGAPPDLAERAEKARDALEAIEGVLVDIRRRSPRDVLRHPAGLNDTLADLIAGVGIADMAPTEPHAAVSRDVIAKVTGEIDRLETLATGEVAVVRRAIAAAAAKAE